MKEAAVHLVQRLLSLRKNKGFGSGEAPRRGSPTSDSGGAELRRFGLGAKAPAIPYSSVSFAPSLWPFSELQPFRLGAKTPAKPYSSVSFAPSPRPLSEFQPFGLGAKTPAKPCSSVSFAPSPWPFSELQPLGLGAKTPAKPCFFISLAPSPKPGWAVPGRNWKKVNGATGYQIYRATSKKGSFTKVKSLASTLKQSEPMNKTAQEKAIDMYKLGELNHYSKNLGFFDD